MSRRTSNGGMQDGWLWRSWTKLFSFHGGHGYFNEQPIERFYWAVKALEIYEGTKEVEK